MFLHIPMRFEEDGQFFRMEKEQDFQFCTNNNFDNWGATILKNKGVCHLPITEFPLLTITGEIPREIDFEKDLPYQYTEDPNNERNLIPDPLIRDD
jgi:hypothetical protein